MTPLTWRTVAVIAFVYLGRRLAPALTKHMPPIRRQLFLVTVVQLRLHTRCSVDIVQGDLMLLPKEKHGRSASSIDLLRGLPILYVENLPRPGEFSLINICGWYDTLQSRARVSCIPPSVKQHDQQKIGGQSSQVMFTQGLYHQISRFPGRP